MNPFYWARRSIQRRGFVQTSKVAESVIRDFLFDLIYGTDTRRLVQIEELDTTSENKNHAVPYQATKAKPFLKLLQRLKLPRQSVFVDFGSGKGRTLLIAARYGFQKVVGIEFSPQLCAVARRNAAVFPKAALKHSVVEVIEQDVALHPIDAEMNVFYMFNPFDGIVLSHVLENIRASLAASPRKVWLIYNTPRHDSVIEQSALFPEVSSHEIGGTVFKVYTN